MISVTFNCGGEKLVVNPSHVAAIQPNENAPNKTLLTVLGHTYKLRGSPALIKAALGWEDGPVVGFDTMESKEWTARLLRDGHSTATGAGNLTSPDEPSTTGNPSSIKGTLSVMGAPTTIKANDDLTDFA